MNDEHQIEPEMMRRAVVEQNQEAHLMAIDRNTKPTEGVDDDWLVTASELITQTVRFVNQPFSHLHDRELTAQLVAFLAEQFEFDHVFIGRLTADKQAVNTVAYWYHGKQRENITYELRGTPCENVLGEGFCSYNQGVAELFPDDKMLGDARVSAYAGQPLWDSEGYPLGIIAVLQERPLTDPSLVEMALQIVAVRAANELEQQQTRQLLELQKRLALKLSALTDAKEMAVEILSELSHANEVDGGCLFVPDLGKQGFVAIHCEGLSVHFVEQVAFIPFVSDWLTLIKEDRVVYRDQFVNEHERDQLRQAAGIQVSANFPIFYAGELVAILSLVSYHFDAFSVNTKHLLETVSSQLGGALARAAAVQELLRSETRYRLMVASLAEGIVVQDQDGAIIACNGSAEKILGLSYEQMRGRTSIDQRWRAVHEDGSTFHGEEHPSMVTLRTGEPQSNVIMGVHKPNGRLRWISINSQPIHDERKMELTGVITSFVDITERILTEQALQYSEARYRQMFQSTQAIKLMIDPATGRIVEANSAAVHFYGYSSRELTQMTIYDIDVADSTRIAEKFQETIDNHQLTATIKHRLASGEIRNVDLYCTPVYMGDETFLYAILHDSTPRKQAEAQLNKLSQAIEQSSIAVMITDNQGVVEYVNPRFTEMTGYLPEDVIGREADFLKASHSHLGAYEELWQTINDGGVWQSEFQSWRKDGVLYWESVAISPIKNAEAVTTHFLIVREDVTRKKVIEETVQQRNLELTLLYNASRSLSTTLDLDEALAGMLEATRQIMSVGACLVWMVADGRDSFVCRQAATPNGNLIQGWDLVNDQGIVGQTVLKNKSNIVQDIGQLRDTLLPISDYVGFDIHSVLSVPLRMKNKVIGVFQLIDEEIDRFTQRDLDLSRTLASSVANAIENMGLHESVNHQLQMLKMTQERLLQSEKLAAIGELVAGVAHELNNPLTAVLLYSQLLERRDITELAKRDLQKIMTQAQRASNVVKGLLDFARQQPPEQKPTQLNSILTSTAELLSYELRNYDVQARLELDEALPITMADPHQLQQVLVNLIQNAIHAMRERAQDGRLILSTQFGPSRYQGHESKEELVLCIMIQDNGGGIPEAVQSKVFDPFFTTKVTGVGTGLGLSVCHGIISEHNGHIWFETVMGDGTTFFIELPMRIPDEILVVEPPISAEGDVLQTAEANLAGVSVLVIDDDSAVRHIMTRILQRRGYHVDSAENGRDGLIQVTKQEYDLILCDLRMPEMGGIEFYEHLVAEYPELAHKILFTTGDTLNISTRHFFNTIQATYLTKPFEVQTFVSVVDKKLQAIDEAMSAED